MAFPSPLPGNCRARQKKARIHAGQLNAGSRARNIGTATKGSLGASVPASQFFAAVAAGRRAGFRHTAPGRRRAHMSPHSLPAAAGLQAGMQESASPGRSHCDYLVPRCRRRRDEPVESKRAARLRGTARISDTATPTNPPTRAANAPIRRNWQGGHSARGSFAHGRARMASRRRLRPACARSSIHLDFG